MSDRSIPPRTETLRRVCLLAASFTIGTFIWFLLGDSDSLVAEETPNRAARDEVLAEVGGIPVTEAEVKGMVAAELEALEAQRRRLLEAALEVRIRELIVEVAAAEQGISPDRLIESEVDQKLDLVAQSEVDALMTQTGPESSREVAEHQARRQLRMEAFIEELKNRPDVETAGL